MRKETFNRAKSSDKFMSIASPSTVALQIQYIQALKFKVERVVNFMKGVIYLQKPAGTESMYVCTTCSRVL